MVRIKQADRQQFLDDTRRRLLTAAADEFSRVGFSGANINTISTSAGFAKGTIYNYFPSKRALLMALIDEIACQHLEYMQERVRLEPDPARRLQRFYQAGFDFVTSCMPKARILFNLINGPDEEFKSYIFSTYQPMFKFVKEAILVYGVDAGLFRPVDPEPMALLLMTIYLGTASQINDQGQPWLDSAQVTELVLNGLHK
jgi:AcrR family transcriptional regulator